MNKKQLQEKLAALKVKRKDENARLAKEAANGTAIPPAELSACFAMDGEIDGLENQIEHFREEPVTQPAVIDHTKLQREAVESERLRARLIREAAAVAMKHCPTIPAEFAEDMINGGDSLESVRAKIHEKMAATSAAVPKQSGAIAFTRDQRDTRRRLIAASMLFKYAPDKIEKYGFKADEGREFLSSSLTDIARQCLIDGSASGEGKLNESDVRRMSKADVAEHALAMHTTSDFPNILADVAHKTLRVGYNEINRTFTTVGRRGTLPDFKPTNRVQLGEMPVLPKINEHGEYNSVTLGEGKEAIRLYSYGYTIGITRNAIINDDLGAFTRIPTEMGYAAARTEGDIAWALWIANAAMADGVALFHATHKNLAAAGGVISTTTIGAAKAAMRVQTGVDGKTVIQVIPSYLIVPAALETVALQFLYPGLLAAVTASVVPDELRSLKLIVEARLDANSAISWYTATSPGLGGVETFEYSYLEGQEGVRMDSRLGWKSDGMELKVAMDFGAKFLDWRGVYKNPGA